MKHASPQTPRQRSWPVLLAFTVLLALPACAQNENASTVVNPGFEDGANGWLIKDAMSTVVPEAAHDGKMGLRISNQDPVGGSSVFSSKLASQESAPAAMAAVPATAVVPAAAPVDLPPRKAPPKIIIKVDDLRQVDGKVNDLWIKFAEFIKSRKIKANIGIICETLETATPEYTQWIKDQQATGLFEFWFHAWDHNTHLENGQQFNEFNNRPYEEQKKRFERSQQLAVEKLGFPFHVFGPPGGVGTPTFDANTIRVMDEDPNMKVWLYPVPLDEPGKQLAAKGKVVILDRVWEVNIESKVGMPDFDKFVAGYAKHPEREYFVIQGHPMHWAPDRFENFVKIIDFLTEQKAEFVLASEYAAHPAAQ